MLFAYKYVPHSIEKLQEYIDHLFLEVWCEADGDYDIDKLHSDLKDIVLEIHYSDTIRKDHLYGPIREIYDLFFKINKGRREALKRWYVNNNSIEDLCGHTNNCKPLHYKRLKQLNAELAPKIEKFFKSLFTEIICLKAVQSKVGKIDEHYKDFMIENDEGKCAFCGINDIKGQYHTKREAYDHYLPKAIYPFNSINFRNLVPMCHECNSSYKTVKDPLHRSNSRQRRKAFYPYTNEIQPPELKIELINKDINNLKPEDIDLDITSKAHQEEIDTWMDVFGIEERYKALCIGKHYGKDWYSQVFDGYETAKVTLGTDFSKDKWINYIITDALSCLFTNGNFIKVAFIKGCQRTNML